MDEYPRTLAEFEARFASDEACRAYLVQLRWPNGFRCPRCGAATAWPVRTVLWQCAACGRQTSVTAGTIFQDTRTPLTTWFRAIWAVTSSRTGTSALALQQVLGLGSYQTAWAWLHKLRRAMVRPGRDQLSGHVEVDESFVGGLGGAQGRSTATKALIVVAAEEVGHGVGRIRMRRIPDAAADSLQGFITDVIQPGSIIHTDGWHGYDRVKKSGYRHEVTFLREEPDLLPRAHRVISLLKRWLLGTHQGAVSQAHLDYYLDEFTFRFNRRTSRHRGQLFFRLVQQAVVVEPVPYKRLVQPGARRRSRRHKGLGSPE